MYGAVSHVVQVELEGERRFAQIARDAVERAEILDDRRIRRRLARRRRRAVRFRSVDVRASPCARSSSDGA